MKKTTRIISCLLVLCMMVVLLASCGEKKPPKDTTPTTTAPTSGQNQTPQLEIDPKWDDVNFDGKKIVVGLNEYVAYPSLGSPNSIKYMEGPDDYTTDAVQNAVYDRNNKVISKLGLEVEYTYGEYASISTLPVIESFVLSDLEGSPDILNAPGYDMVRAGIKGLLYNALDTEDKNYLELTDEYGWYVNLMKENTLDESKIFMLMGDYFIDVLRYASGIFVNIDMYEDLFQSEGGIESLYETIELGEWDYDELMRLSEVAYVDKGVLGVDDEEDTFGITCQHSWYHRDLFSTSGLDVFEVVDGQVRYIQDISEVHDFVDKLMEIMSLDSCVNPYQFGGGSMLGENRFIAGKTLFSLSLPVSSLEGTSIRNMEQKAGIIPFPKYNPELPYKALVHDYGSVGGILYNSDVFTECTALIQLMSEESNGGKGTLIYEYYEVTLKYKLSSDPGQLKMLETIRQGVCSPKSMLYDSYFAKNVGLDPYFTLMNKSVQAGTNTFASDWASQYNAVQKSLEDTFATYGAQQ